MSDEIYENRKLISSISNLKRTKGRKEYKNGVHVGTGPDTVTFTTGAPLNLRTNGNYELRLENEKIIISKVTVKDGTNIEAVVFSNLTADDES